MEKKKISILVIAMLFIASTILLAIPAGKAIVPPATSVNVAFVPSPSQPGVGTLPTTNVAFNSFTFTNLAWASVSAANLAPFDTVVLYINSATVPLTAPQQTDLINWVSAGGKLIIYDAEVTPGVDYSWLPYPMTTENPGAQGYDSGAITYVEDNTLGSTSAGPYFIDITMVPTGGWSDAVGDCNVFVTYDPHWCGDIKAQNWYSYPASRGYDGSPEGWVHTYAQYGSGLFIYNGFDTDPLSASSVPDPTISGSGNLAKIWLMELQTPWGADYALPCTTPIVAKPVGGYAVPVNKLELLAPWIALASVVSLAGAVAVALKKSKR